VQRGDLLRNVEDAPAVPAAPLGRGSGIEGNFDSREHLGLPYSK
jgi:hypothetical protein